MNNIIVMNRGDTLTFDITIADDTLPNSRYILQGNDTVYLGIMDPNQMFEDALVKKRYTVDDIDAEGNLIALIEPEDTLDLFPGKYYYSVKLKVDHYDTAIQEHIDKVITVINKTKFIIC